MLYIPVKDSAVDPHPSLFETHIVGLFRSTAWWHCLKNREITFSRLYGTHVDDVPGPLLYAPAVIITRWDFKAPKRVFGLTSLSIGLLPVDIYMMGIVRMVTPRRGTPPSMFR